MTYQSKKKIEHNISEFSSFKILSTWKKAKSPHTVVFVTNDPEGWFINCVEYRTKSGVVIHDDFIIEGDLEDWYKWHEGLGWIRN